MPRSVPLAAFAPLVVAVPMLLPVSGSLADDWPAFRGAANDGICAETSFPMTWGPNENIAWRAKLPRPGNGSAIVVAGRVLVTSAEDEKGTRRSLYAFDRTDGKQLWVRTVEFGKELPTHETNPFCGTTPVSDGKRVVVWHASAGLYCYDLDGNELWSRNLGEFQHMWGYGTSPILYRDRVILHTGPGKSVMVTALDLEKGTTLWESSEPVEGDGNYNAERKYVGSWCTPVVAHVEGRDQVIVTLPLRVNAYDPDTGEIVWWCNGVRHDNGDLAYSSPSLVGDICVITGGYGGAGLGIRLGGSGDVTETHRLWRTENNPQSIGSAVTAGGSLYRPNASGGTIQCLDPQTGTVRWTGRAGDANFWASLVLSGELAYGTDQNGTTVIFKPNPDSYEEVARNELGEATNATPAFSDGQLFFRTMQHLVCVGP